MNKESWGIFLSVGVVCFMGLFCFIYFIMTQTEVIEEAYISMNIVENSPTLIDNSKIKSLDILVLPGEYQIGGRSFISIHDVKPFIFQKAQTQPDLIVNLKLSDKVDIEHFVKLLDLLDEAKLQEHLNITYLK